MRPLANARLLASLLVGLLCVAIPAAAQPGTPAEPTQQQRTRTLRGLMQDARAFLRQGRAESAERTLQRGLLVAPDDARLHQLLARALAAQGRAEDAKAQRRRADEIDPPPPPLPSEPLVASARGIVVALVPPAVSDEPPTRVPRDWPAGVAARALAERLQLRLPGAQVTFASPQSVAEARAWLAARAPRGALSLRVDRSYCKDTLKDGFFALARLRIAGEVPGAASRGPGTYREVVNDPREDASCEVEALGRTLERALEHPGVRRSLEAPALTERRAGGEAPGWSTPAIRALFPGITERIDAEIDHGRTQLAGGRIAAAAETFRRAAQLDPEDGVVQTYLAEAEATLAMAAEIAPASGRGAGDHGVLDPRFSAAQRKAAEARLDDERRRRADLLATEKILKAGTRAPAPQVLAELRSALVNNPRAFGPTTARRLALGAVGAREAVTPDGSVFARYYTDAGGALVLEEGIDSDGHPNRWIAYAADGSRSEMWEDRFGRGKPDVHFVYAARGDDIARVELDADRDGEVDRIIGYADGALTSESRDTDGDGVLDRFDHFDDRGFVTTRDEDFDGDGEIDARTTFRAGRLIERTLWDLGNPPGDT